MSRVSPWLHAMTAGIDHSRPLHSWVQGKARMGIGFYCLRRLAITCKTTRGLRFPWFRDTALEKTACAAGIKTDFTDCGKTEKTKKWGCGDAGRVWTCVWVHLSVWQPLLAPLAAAHHLVVHLHVAPAAVLSVAVVAAVRTCSWRTWWHKDKSCIKMLTAPLN